MRSPAIFFVIFVTLAFAVAIAAYASTTSQKRPPDLLPKAVQTGHVVVKFLGMTLYNATLYTQSEQVFEWTYPFVLELDYSRPFSDAFLIGATMSELDRMEGRVDDRGAIETALGTCFKSVDVGDVYTAFSKNPNQLAFFLNGTQTCQLNFPNISPRVLGIWLSENTRNTRINRQLRGLN